MIFPAQIGRLAYGLEPGLACDFISFVLSDAGQRLLLDPGVGRIPVAASLRDDAAAAELAPIERLLTRLPVSESEAAREVLNASPGRISDLIMMTPEQDEARADWAAAAARQLDEADRALAVLERRAKGMRP